MRYFQESLNSELLYNTSADHNASGDNYIVQSEYNSDDDDFNDTFSQRKIISMLRERMRGDKERQLEFSSYLIAIEAHVTNNSNDDVLQELPVIENVSDKKCNDDNRTWANIPDPRMNFMSQQHTFPVHKQKSGIRNPFGILEADNENNEISHVSDFSDVAKANVTARKSKKKKGTIYFYTRRPHGTTDL